MGKLYHPPTSGVITTATGWYVKHGNGMLDQWFYMNCTTTGWDTATGAFFGPSAEMTWTFPFPFVDGGKVAVCANVVRLGALAKSGVNIRDLTAIDVDFFPFVDVSLNNASSKSVCLQAKGTWF